MVNCEKLTNAGVDMSGLLKRLMGNEALVGLFIRKFTEDTTFARLIDAVAQMDASAMEMTSHTLKGMCGNLSLTRLYGLFTQQVELIRRGELSAAAAMMDTITPIYTCAIAEMKAWLAEQ